MSLCIICGHTLHGHGNNPWPLSGGGRACDRCNVEHVVPARVNQWPIFDRQRCTKCGGDAMHWFAKHPHFLCCRCHVVMGGEASEYHEGCREAALRLR